MEQIAGLRRAVVFDLDGTLIDSLPDIVFSFREACVAAGLPRPGEGEVRALIGRPLDEMAEVFTQDARVVGEVSAAYRRIYPLHFTERTRPFPGAVETLRALRGLGVSTAVATTKRSDMARRLVEALGMAGELDHVQGTDGFAHKPAPDVIHVALEALGAVGEWMVGDTVTDLQAGRAAGLRTYGVSWGTHDAATLATAEPDVLADDLGQLLTLVE